MAGAADGTCIALFDCGNQIASGLAHDAAGAVLNFVAGSVESGAIWIVERCVGMVFAYPTPHLGAQWFMHSEGLMAGVAKFLLLPLLAAATIGPVLRQDLRGLARVWVVGLPVAVIAGLGAAALTNTGLVITDGLCSAIAGNAATLVGAGLSHAMGSQVVPGAPIAVGLLAGVALLIGGLLLWLELVLRDAAVYIAVFFAPLALATFVWPAAASVAKRTAQVIVALVAAKFVIVAALVLGATALGPLASAGSGLIGVAIVMMAAVAPFSLLRLVPLVEVAAIAHLEGMARRPFHAVSRATSSVTANPIAKTLLSKAGRSKDPVTSPVSPHTIPERAPDYIPGRTRGGASSG